MGQGRHHLADLMKGRAEHTRQQILAFFRKFPFATQADCAAELGITIATVSRHVQVLRERMREDMRA